MRTLLIIMAHREAQETVDRHLPYWEAHRHDLTFFCPEDSIVNPRGHWIWAYGPKGHHNDAANRRFKEMINLAWLTSHDRVVVFEYDAICVQQNIPLFFERRGPELPDSLGLNIPDPSEVAQAKDFSRPWIAANVFRDDSPNRGFKGTTFTHPPLIMTRQGLNLIRPLVNALPDDAESCFWDRMLGLALENGGIEPFDLMKAGLGYAQNTIEEQHFPSAHQAAWHGAIFFHGVKTQAALDVILKGHEHAKRDGNVRHGLEVPL